MAIRKPRAVVLAAAVAIMSSPGAACGLVDRPDGGASPGSPTPEDAAAKSRERVQNYLDAMRAKDVAKGRSQLCPPIQEIFDKNATGANGDFADHFTVPEATITDVRASGGDQQVSAAVTVSASGESMPVTLRFTVTKAAGEWCIAGETPAPGPPTPAPS